LELRGFLSRGYGLKAIADYETGPEAIIGPDQAKAAIADADALISFIRQLINAGDF
jgi:hypothetical protein